jgi:malonyl CoA-acyl carrier protein transacylase
MTTVDDHLSIGNFQTSVRADDPLARDHRVNGVATLPGVALLDAIMRAATRDGREPAGLELGNVLFERPVTVPEGATRRLIFRSSDHEDAVRVTVATSDDDDPGAEVACAECLVRPAGPGGLPDRLDVAAVRLAVRAGGTPMADLYAATAALGVDHGPFMRARGTVLTRDDGLVAELVLGPEAEEFRDDFLAPPMFLDAAVVVAVAGALRAAGDTFLPVYLGRFRVWGRAGAKVYVVTPPGGAVRRGDALETDVRIYDAEGRPIAELERLTAMRLRPEPADAPSDVPPPTAADPVPAGAVAEVRPARRLQIAVVGMSGRYPGADDLVDLWDNLENGRDTIGTVPPNRWNPADYETPDRRLSRFGAFLSDIDKFDPLFFRIPPAGVELLDPQERLFLQTAYGAIENAGYSPDGFAAAENRIGVYVGATWTDYRLLAAEAARKEGTPTAVSALSSIANRVSYTFNFSGPSIVVDTACSASLTALHLACRAIADGDCDAALAGGVNLLLHPDKYLIYRQINLVSSDGRLRSFGAGGDGHVPGEGVGALFLKPLDRAIADGDTIHGVILATAVNHGGQAAGFTVPQPAAQGEVIRRALDDSGVDPDSIGYVEAHGTGTALGDPVEIAGLAKAYAGRTRPLPVGSVKSNLGHLESAAGVVGVTRALLQFRHGRIAPSLHSEVLNPEIDFSATPFYVPQRTEPWPRRTVGGGEEPRRSGVSSFGAGGSNAHVVIEEYLAPPRQPDHGAEVVVLSARSADRLREYAARMARYLGRTDESGIVDIARTLQIGRPALEHRLAFAAASVADAASRLSRFADGDVAAVATGTARASAGEVPASRLIERYRAGDLQGAAQLWAAGATPDWTAVNDGPRRRLPLPGYPFERRSFWAGELRAAVEGDPVRRSAPEHDALTAVKRRFEESLTPEPRALEALFPDLGRYAAAALHRSLIELGVPPGPTTAQDIRRRIGVVPEYERFVDACLAVLERHGRLNRDGGSIDLLPAPDDPVRLRADLLARSPEAAPFIRFVDTCLGAFPDVLTGRRPATEVLFADSRMDLMAGIYRGNRVYDFYSELVARFVAHAVAERSGRLERPVRVLELGAGTGGTSHAALAALAAGGHPVEYLYTDVGGSFVAHGRRTFGPDYPFADFRLFDMEKDPREQGIEPAGLDVVLVVGALHAVADIDEALRRVRSMLAPQGILVLGEAVEDHDVMAVAAGLFAGWTRYRDPERRIAHSPLLTEDGWRQAFARTGFEGFTAYGPGLTGDRDPGHRVMVATRSAAEATAARTQSATPAPARPVAAVTVSADYDLLDADYDLLDEDERADRCEPVIAGIVAAALGIRPDDVDPERSFAEYGVDSILAVTIAKEVNERLGLSVKPTVLFDYPSVRDLSFFAVSEGARPVATEETPEPAPVEVTPVATAPVEVTPVATAPVEVAPVATAPVEGPADSDFAVIGMAARYPGADDYRELWRNLAEGRDAVTELPRDRWDVERFFQPGPPTPGKTYSRWGAYLTGTDLFDPLFFGMSPAEADFMDPQQRLFLQESWRALEDAGIDARSLRGSRCGVFAGAPPSDYLDLIRERGYFAHHGVFTGNSPAILPARIAYHLDLVGPCVTIDTACSSSLVAIHQACRSLMAGECDMALAGGVAVFATPEHQLLSASLGMLSPTGRCRPFDAAADGLALSEGVGVVVLKPLARAIADGDPVHGVIKGSAVNQDGRTNGITAPSARSQTALECEVYDSFGIDPATIDYVEAHGTGTSLGDPIEVEALTAAFRRYTERRQFVALGSIKSNIGHSSHAAGVAGLIKVLLAMRAGQLPPSLHFDTPNPLIGFEQTPFFVNTSLTPWPGERRRAAVSSFGFSGTNCHLVVEEYADTRVPGVATESAAVVPLSAQSRQQVRESAAALARFLGDRPGIGLAEIAATLRTGRATFDHRLAVVATSVPQLRRRLELAAAGEPGAGVHEGTVPPGSARTAAASGLDPEEAARLWVVGAVSEGSITDPAGDARRIHLPGYPFARESCWVPEAAPDTIDPDTSPAPAAGSTGGGSDFPRRAEEYLRGVLAGELRLPPERLRTRAPFEEYGIESVLIARITRRLEQDLGDLPSTLFFEYQTIEELAGYLADEYQDRLATMSGAPLAHTATTTTTTTTSTVTAATGAVTSGSAASSPSGDIAVIGMAGRFPQAESVDALWDNLVAGRDCITEIPSDRWDHSRYLSDDPDEPGRTYARWGGFMPDVDRFDARFFGIPPKDAEGMDPQQRLFLETSWAALEDAGYPPERARRTARRRGTKDVGVFAGVTYGEYQLLVGIPIAGYWAVANRVSYHFGFNGPSMAVDTACSSSLTAVHQACASLRRGECGYALAGGVNVTIHPGKFLLLGLGRWAAGDGRCRTFGAGGDGYVPGEGVATLLLKPLADALADGDRIHGVIRSSVVNQDGRTNGFTVPSLNAQAELVYEALDEAGVDPRELSYVEAHGTGTSLGDPIEVAALTKAFRRFTPDRGYCAIGSAKSSIGHLEAAAGVTGLVKVLLQLRHDTIAPSLHAEPPNPNIDFAGSPFRVAVRPEPWSRDDGSPRVAAVSSFGAGGSNAHVIVQDAPVTATHADARDRGPHLVVLSAHRREQLDRRARDLAGFLRSPRGRATVLDDVAWTAAVGRESFEHRLAVVAEDHEHLAVKLEEFAGGAAEDAYGLADRHQPAGGESDEDLDRVRALAARGDAAGIGRLWLEGWAIDWEDVARSGSALPPGRIVSLPGYPFARDRHWIVPEDYGRQGTEPTEPAAAGPAELPAAAPLPPPESGRPDPAVLDELELRIKEIFSDLTKMPIAELDVDSDFVDFGFDSVVSVRMLNRLMKSYEVRIPGAAIEEYTTIRSFAEHLIEAGYIAGEGVENGADPRIARIVTAPARLPEKLQLARPLPVASVLITGVTGVLGGRLLYDLLADTEIRVRCLVRGEDLTAARARVRYFLDVYDTEGRLAGEFERRVAVLLGDVSQEHFGLEESQLAAIAEDTDLTIHAAARTTLVSFYDALAPVNVEGTRRAIDFALRTRNKYLVYVSSFSALGDWQIYDNPPFRESDIELGQGYDHLPYQETKYHAEKLIRAATDEGLVWNIFRPGNIMGDSRTGRYPFAEVTVKGVFYDIFKTTADTGVAMLSPNPWDISPVDYVSAGLLHLALRRPSYRETYHLTNPDVRSLYDIFTLIGDFGYPIRPVSIDEFHRMATESLFRKAAVDRPYQSQTIEMVKYGIEIWGREHYEHAAYPDSAYTRSVLGPAGIDCPTVAELVPLYLHHCIDAGYLDPPAGYRPPAGKHAAAGAAPRSGTTAVVFPGQGAQRQGMAADFHERFAVARRVFEEASEAAGADLARICFTDARALRRTEFTQPCLLTAEIAAYRVAVEEFGLSAQLFGGHSLGEFSALVAAEVIPLAEAVRLVRRRGLLMQQSVPEGEGGMAALILDDIEASGVAAMVVALGAEVANDNSPQQIAVSGTTACLEKVRHVLAEALPGLDFVPLKVSAPFHSRFMRPVEADFAEFLRDSAQRWDLPRAASVASNVTGGLHDPDELVVNLSRQLSSPVRWRADMAVLTEHATRVVEIGPRGSLTKFFLASGYSAVAVTSVADAEQRLRD